MITLDGPQKEPLTLFTFADQVTRMMEARNKYAQFPTDIGKLAVERETRLVREMLAQIEANKIRLNQHLAEQNKLFGKNQSTRESNSKKNSKNQLCYDL